jgi:hypothetical protein
VCTLAIVLLLPVGKIISVQYIRTPITRVDPEDEGEMISETSADLQRNTQRYIPEDRTINIQYGSECVLVILCCPLSVKILQWADLWSKASTRYLIHSFRPSSYSHMARGREI